MKLLLPLLLTLTITVPHASAADQAHKKPPARHPQSVKAAASRPPAVAAKPAPVEQAGAQFNFGEWKEVAQFEEQMVSRHGFTRAELDALIAQVRFVNAAVQLIKPAPPGKPKNWHAYSALFIEPVRIGAGVRFWDENAETLMRAESEYGVPAEIIVGILGVETVYGRHTGRFRVLDTLTTLAFAYPQAPNRDARMAFFRGELENTLVLTRQFGIEPFSLLGSFAGAVGLPQFMPGNIIKYGVDYDGDGKVDLRGSAADAIGSIANFLVQHGWDRNDKGPPVRAAAVSPSRAWESFLAGGLVARYRPSQLREAGVTPLGKLEDEGLYGLIDLQNGADPTEYWIANNNFFAITNYNRSYFYAMSVLELGRAVRLSRGGGPLKLDESL
jgi:membrane-bound lytic murein transglycosylase B